MKRIALFFIFIFIFCQINFSQKIVFLHTNDMHSNLTGFGPESEYSPLVTNNDKTVGGFARLASIIEQEKQKNPNNLIVCDAGDFLMGTIFQAAEAKTGFELLLMKQIGYDVITLGNHEFDYGPLFLANVINTAKNIGEIPAITANQLIFSDKKEDDELEKLVKNNTLKQYHIIEKNGLKIGFFGLLGEEAIYVAAGASPVTFDDMFKTAKNITKTLREVEKVDIIVCLSHGGVYPNEKGKMIGDDINLAKKVPDIDIIIGGHTHFRTEKNIQIGKTIIVQAGCYTQSIGRLEINYENGKVTVVDFKIIDINDEIMGNKQVSKSIKSQKSIVEKMFFEPFNLSFDKPLAETDFNLYIATYNSKTAGTVGFFTADAINYYTDKYSTQTDIVLVAGGIVRENIMKGDITAADVFRVSPLGHGLDSIPGNPLAQIYINGNEIKKIMELFIANNKIGADSYIYLSGVEVHYNPKKPFLKKINKILINGKEINTSKKATELFSITANIYLLNFIGEIKKMSKGLIKIIPKDANGNPITDMNNNILDFDKNKQGIQEGKEWIALIEFLKQLPDLNNNGIPDMPKKYEAEPKIFIQKN